MRYEIRVAGRLPINWTDWCDGFICTILETGETVLAGPVLDQAALAGLLSTMCQLNLTVLSVTCLDRN